jgi:hypothetical protein
MGHERRTITSQDSQVTALYLDDVPVSAAGDSCCLAWGAITLPDLLLIRAWDT